MPEAGVTITSVRQIAGVIPLSARHDWRVGISNAGALRDAALSVIQRAFGIDASGRRLAHMADGRTVVAARSNDLPHLLAAGILDLAITAHDYAIDSGQPINELVDFMLVPGRIVVLAPASRQDDWQGSARLRVCSQYPRIAAAWASGLGRPVDVIAVDGAAEVFPHIGVADVIVDNVSSGATAAANSLVEVDFVMSTTLRLYCSAKRLEEERIKKEAFLLAAAAQ